MGVGCKGTGMNHEDRGRTELDTTGGVWALGNFDGVHRGHQAVIAAALDVARGLGLPVRVLTLEPHPRTLLAAPQTPFRLTLPSVKNRLLQELGVEEVVTLNFSPELASMTAEAFVEKILVQHYRAQHVVAGAEFVFGRGRTGTMQDMRVWLGPMGIGVTDVPPFRDEAGEIVSSSRLRTALHQGDLETAGKLLGRPWAISGVITRGGERGRTMGIPTANMELGETIRPPFGVYAVMAHRAGDKVRYPGAANIGVRPTVDGVHELMEFHLFHFQGDIYDQEWEVELHHFLRSEQKFSDLEALQDQIMRDITHAGALLSFMPPRG
jgi:riboflavin kinase / FMN adenylyltransferase